MYLYKMLKNMFYVIIFCLFIILISGFLYYLKAINNDTKNDQYMINQMRLRTSTIMTYLEVNADSYFLDKNEAESLKELCKNQEVELITTDLTGKILFKSSSVRVEETLDLRNDLHYDLYTAKLNQNTFRIAFPLIQVDTQVGNAVFIIPNQYIAAIHIKNSIVQYFISIVLVCLGMGGILWILYKQIKTRLLLPVTDLKYLLEAIVKGDYDKKSDYVSGDLNEVGELYNLYEQMRLELHSTAEVKKQKDIDQKELISSISHDLKTPISVLKTYAEGIRCGICKDMESVMEYIEIMETHIDKLARNSNDLLFHMMKELGQLTVKPYEQYSKSVLENILKPIAHYVEKEGIEFIAPPDLPDVLISVDANRLEQVISNLISNALKHTKEGDTIKVSTEMEEAFMKFIIEDTGEGILVKDMPFIFNRYFQGEHISGRQKDSSEGSGLGLSICQNIIEAHGGNIGFRSKKGEGTVFYFTIPLV